MTKRNLVLCFDAFGTLFKPVRPITQQYAEVARQCGLTGFQDHDLQTSFKTAFKAESKENPNYGNQTGLGATKWWTNVINRTFTPLVARNQKLPDDLAPRLLQRFSSSEAYTTEPNLVANIKALKRRGSMKSFDQIIIGIITNSDDRVPGVLSSFGLNVSPLRYGVHPDSNILAKQDYDIDFHCMSYDVGVEKPNRLIFEAADSIIAQIIKGRDDTPLSDNLHNVQDWQHIYVGDEYDKDVVGARNAGWKSILLDSEDKHTDITRMEDHPGASFESLLQEYDSLTTRSLHYFLERL